jgi:hypothetical protein
LSIYRPVVLGCGLAIAVLLVGCAAPPAAPVSTTRLYAIDQAGAAKQCTVGPVTLTAGKETAATMSVRNDGGWCAISVAQSGHPYSAGLLATPAAHGKVYVHTVGDDTRIDYTPDPGYAGPDAFTVTLLPGRPALKVGVTVVR